MKELAKVVWTACDVQEVFPDMTDEAAEEFLVNNQKHIQAAMTEAGWEAIRTCGECDEEEEPTKSVTITLSNLHDSGSTSHTARFSNIAQLKADVALLVFECEWSLVDVQLVPNWEVTPEEQAAFDEIEGVSA